MVMDYTATRLTLTESTEERGSAAWNRRGLELPTPRPDHPLTRKQLVAEDHTSLYNHTQACGPDAFK